MADLFRRFLDRTGTGGGITTDDFNPTRHRRTSQRRLAKQRWKGHVRMQLKQDLKKEVNLVYDEQDEQWEPIKPQVKVVSYILNSEGDKIVTPNTLYVLYSNSWFTNEEIISKIGRTVNKFRFTSNTKENNMILRNNIQQEINQAYDQDLVATDAVLAKRKGLELFIEGTENFGKYD